ncbi:hypothetical protein K0T92_22105 [Paenibacillus oenotherae]|uniref:Uncharacterized protein n=1 Tax=Paenibacillus oenotherae TaxID=1435645 RepID=A0ABS7DD45_9BACL|nr:hypothetical protein [Paenibacillus oenotherae]MBW7477417.1 hypothetical protein [Paenibacillus oenotherae]
MPFIFPSLENNSYNFSSNLSSHKPVPNTAATAAVAPPAIAKKDIVTISAAAASMLVAAPQISNILSPSKATAKPAPVSASSSAGFVYSANRIKDDSINSGKAAIALPTRLSPNEQILRAKLDYDNAQKIGDKAAMNAASALASTARSNGATISINVTLDEAMRIVANKQIAKSKDGTGIGRSYD